MKLLQTTMILQDNFDLRSAHGAGHGFMIGIGSNQDPMLRLPQALRALVRSHGSLLVSRVYETIAAGDQAGHGANFFNLVVYLHSPRDASELKLQLRQLEQQLGRDRRHPMRHLRPVSMDLDILHGPLAHGEGGLAARGADSITRQSYLQRPLHEILSALGMAAGDEPEAPGRWVEVPFDEGLLLGSRPVVLSETVLTDLLKPAYQVRC